MASSTRLRSDINYLQMKKKTVPRGISPKSLLDEITGDQTTILSQVIPACLARRNTIANAKPITSSD